MIASPLQVAFPSQGRPQEIVMGLRGARSKLSQHGGSSYKAAFIPMTPSRDLTSLRLCTNVPRIKFDVFCENGGLELDADQEIGVRPRGARSKVSQQGGSRYKAAFIPITPSRDLTSLRLCINVPRMKFDVFFENGGLELDADQEIGVGPRGARSKVSQQGGSRHKAAFIPMTPSWDSTSLRLCTNVPQMKFDGFCENGGLELVADQEIGVGP